MPLAPTGVRAAASVPLLVALAVLVVVLTACEAGPPPVTPAPVAGTPDAPREVNLIAKDYIFQPATLDLIPGETVLLHVINGGLEVHEAVIGDGEVQAAWERAEAATVGGAARARRRSSASRPTSPGCGSSSDPASASTSAGPCRTMSATPRPRRTGPSGATSPATSPTGCRSRSAGSPRPHHERAGWYAFAPAAG